MERIASVPFRFDHGDWDSNLRWLERLNYRAAIVGKKGSGKTTLLAELADRLHDVCYINLPHDREGHAELLRQAEKGIEKGQRILVDGIERLTWYQREKLFFQTAGQAGLIVAVHRRCRLPTWITCRTDESLMAQIVDDLKIGSPQVNAAAMDAFQKTHGNIRDALRLLYDQFARGKLADPIAEADASN